MNDWLLLVLTALFCFRVTRLVTDDVIFEPIRSRIEPRLGMYWGNLLVCHWCVSAYVCAPVIYFLDQWLGLTMPLLWYGAVWALVGLIAENWDKEDHGHVPPHSHQTATMAPRSPSSLQGVVSPPETLSGSESGLSD